MKNKILLFIILTSVSFLFARGQSSMNLAISHSSIPDKEQKEISKQLELIHNRVKEFDTREIDNVLYKYISHFKCTNLELFIKRIIVNDTLVDHVTLSDSVLTIYYQPGFYLFLNLLENQPPLSGYKQLERNKY